MSVAVEPLLQEYVAAPATVKLLEFPKHKKLFELVVTNTGKAFTVRFAVAVFTPGQPAVLLPIMVNVVLAVGVTTALPP